MAAAVSSPSDGLGLGPVLVSIGGLPACGKTTVARAVAADMRAAYVRIDSIETAIARAEWKFEPTNSWDLPPGYTRWVRRRRRPIVQWPGRGRGVG